MLNEFIQKVNRQKAFDVRDEKLHESSRYTNTSKRKAKETNRAFLVRTVPTRTIGGVMQVLRKSRVSS